ncbi:F-box/WD repeat-containing protein 1A [Termitomyces sp. T112]|nr:F-box/WD repeat-containing protein 1A [Termitomyces sp. T112]
MSTTFSTTSPSPLRTRHRRHSSHPGFSHLFDTVLGSPFLTTSDLPDSELVDGAPLIVPHAHTVTRPPSPTPTVDSSTFSFVQFDFNVSTPNRSPFKSILPRIWDVLSTPRSPYNLYTHSYGPQRTHTKYFDGSINYNELDPLGGEEGELVAIDDEACFFVDAYYGSRAVTGIDIIALLPPELAMYTFMQLCTGPSSLYTILTCGAVSRTWRALATDNTVWRALFLSCWDVNLTRGRRSIVNPRLAENTFWRTPEPVAPTVHPEPSIATPKKKRRAKRLFSNDGGFSFSSSSSTASPRLSSRRLFSPTQSILQPRHVPPSPFRSAAGSSSSAPSLAPCRTVASLSVVESVIPIQDQQKDLNDAPLQLDWQKLYRIRLELERRWNGTTYVPVFESPLPPPNSLAPSPRHLLSHPYAMLPPFPSPKMVPYVPHVLSITGHTDSVYCLEFDSKRIITGSRDRTIKVWSLKNGRLLGSFNNPIPLPGGELQGHTGSVLCLKFSVDWDLGEEDSEGAERKQGFMVSGSSDYSVCVWNLWTGSRVGDDGDREVKGELRTILRGHTGGVLDLRIDDRWIVSCSKDAGIRVWDRETLTLARVLRGHEGPVNSVGLQAGRVVSASADGKMILWDIASGERIRTFEGHDRGLACIEFKDGLIVSGSTDCKIKVWSAETGECMRTLLGHQALIRALAFDLRCGRLVSASYDKTVKVWDFPTGQLVREFKDTHTSHIFDVKFDAARIVSTSHDHKIVVIDFSHGLDTSLFV